MTDESFIKIMDQVECFYTDVLKCFYQKQVEKALLLSDNKYVLVDIINDFSDSVKSTEKNFIYMIDRLRRLVGTISEMNRLTYNES